MTIKFMGLAAAAVALFGLNACSGADELTLQKVIDAHTAARGGAKAIEALHSIEIKIDIVEPKFEVHGHYRAKRDGHMRIDIYAGDQRVFTEALDGADGWQLLKDATVGTKLSADGKASLERGIVGNLFGLHELPALGYKLSLGPRVEVDGVNYITVNSISPEGFEHQYFIDPKSYMIVRERDESALHPDLDPKKRHFETVFSDFSPAGGVMFNHHAQKRDLKTGEVVQTITTESIETNVDFDPGIFVAPAG